MQEGCPARAQGDPDLKPYCQRRDELSTEEGCLMWGSRMVVPPRGRKRALSVLHEAHPGIVRMKALARGYMWWPGMDEAIGCCVKECSICQCLRKMPPSAPLHPWARPEKPWSRVHIDYAGPFEGKMFLLITDAYSKWLEVHCTNTSTSAVTIELLRKSFSYLGLLEVIVSDNTGTFTSTEFAEFLEQNGVRHIRSPPYHPASNGLAERAVQTFKEGLKRFKTCTLSARLSRFFLWYRITPHSTTGSSPSELMWGRRLRSKLDLLLPDGERRSQEAQDSQKRAHDSHAVDRQFNVSDTVYVRNYGEGQQWLLGRVVGLQGSAIYRVRLDNDHVIIIVRHVDQLRHRVTTTDSSDDVQDTGDSTEPVDVETSETPETPTMTSSPETPESGRGIDEEPTGNSSDETDVLSSQEPDLQKPPDKAGATSTRRCSSRVSRPPVRFE